MYGIDPEKLKQRVEARKAAEAALALVAESVAGDALHFWTIIRDAGIRKAPFPGGRHSTEPMTDKEAAVFGQRVMPYGKYVGDVIECVDLQYLDWLAGTVDEWKPELQRYLLNEGVRSRLFSQLQDDEDENEDVAAD